MIRTHSLFDIISTSTCIYHTNKKLLLFRLVNFIEYLISTFREPVHHCFIQVIRHKTLPYVCNNLINLFVYQERECDDLGVASIFGSAKASQEADNILILQDKRLSSIRGRKYIQVS